MKTIADLNNELENIDKEIEETSAFLDDAREDYQRKKAEHEVAMAKTYLELKTTNGGWTESRLKSAAIAENAVKRMELISAESTYRKIQTTLNRLRDRFDSIKEQSYNIRADLKKLG